MSFANHTLILKNDDTLWACGQNWGQLGLENAGSKTTFTQVTTNTDNIKSVYGFFDHTFILKNDDTLWGCGWSVGTLGLGAGSGKKTIFTQITTNADNIKSVYCGYGHTIILKNDGTLWGCGENGNGQIGLGNTTARNIFTQITTNTNDIKSVYCGHNHTLILKNDDTLWGCGNNSYGQLGIESAGNKTTFTIIDTNPGNIKSICCGSNCTLMLQNNGILWGCGSNSNGQLGLGDKTNVITFTKITNNIKSVYCGYQHTIILKNDGTLWGCGKNESGQLGLGDTTDRKTFTQLTTNANNIKSVYCGYQHTIILKSDGTLWGCGHNTEGQLGLGDKNNRNILTQITTNTDNIKSFANNYPNISSVIKIYDTKIGYVETLDANNFRNISINTFEKLKALYTKPSGTLIGCIISFDKKQTWKSFNGTNWINITNNSPENIILNCMDIEKLNQLDKDKLISGGFTGDLDFKIAIKSNDTEKTPSITKIYIEYK